MRRPAMPVDLVSLFALLCGKPFDQSVETTTALAWRNCLFEQVENYAHDRNASALNVPVTVNEGRFQS